MLPNKETDAGIINPVVFTPSMLISSTVAENDFPVWALGTYAVEDKVVSPQTHRSYECLVAHVGVATSATAVVTMNIAAVALVTWNNHGLPAGAEVTFTTAGTLPTGVVANVKYYVLSPEPNTFNLSATIGGVPITTTGVQSGQHKCSVRSTLPHESNEGDFAKWEDIGATNKYAMFDEKWGTQTKGNGALTVVIAPGVVIDSLSVLNVMGAELEITSRVDGIVKYTRTIRLISDIGVYDWKTYFLAPIIAKRDVIVNDLLPYSTQELTIRITGSGAVAIGNICMGTYISLGRIQWHAKVGAISFAKKQIDRWGNRSVEKGAIVKRFGGTLEVPTGFADQLQAIFMSVLDMPIVFAGAGSQFSCLIGWGFVNDFEIDLAYKTTSYCSFTFESIV